jgi:uncharacterized membrane protein YfhO
MVYTTIPYDVGWSVEVDGMKVETIKVNNGFIGFKIDSGQHQIEMNYVPQGMWVGAIVTVISVLIVIYLVIKRKGEVK